MMHTWPFLDRNLFKLRQSGNVILDEKKSEMNWTRDVLHVSLVV